MNMVCSKKQKFLLLPLDSLLAMLVVVDTCSGVDTISVGSSVASGVGSGVGAGVGTGVGALVGQTPARFF